MSVVGQDIELANMGGRVRVALGWKGSAQVAVTMIQVITGIVLARLLLPSDFGILAASMTVIALARIFQDFGLGQALVQREDIKPIHLVSVFWGTLLMGLMILGAITVAAPYAGAFFNEPRLPRFLKVIALSFVITPMGVVPGAVLQRRLDFKLPFIARIIGAAAYAAVGVSMAVGGYGYWSLAGAQLAVVVGETSAICALTRYVPPLVPSLRGLRDLLGFATGVAGVGILNYIAQQADYVVVGRCLGSKALGLYGKSFNTVHQPMSMISASVFPVLFPAFSRLQGDPERARSAFGRAITGISMITFPALALLAVSAPELIPIVLGKQWQGAVILMQILSIAGMLRTVVNPGAALARGFGRVYSQMWRNGVYAAVLTLAALVGTLWGTVGVAWGAVTATVVVFCLNAQLVHACCGFGLRHYAKALRGGTLSAAAVVLVGSGVRILALSIGQAMGVVLMETLLSGVAIALLTTFFSPFPEWKAVWAMLLRRHADTSTQHKAKDTPSSAQEQLNPSSTDTDD